MQGFPNFEDTDGGKKPDTIIANIYAELVDELLVSTELDLALEKGRLILSGISHQKVDMVRNRLSEKGFTIQAEQQEAWWYAIHATR